MNLGPKLCTGMGCNVVLGQPDQRLFQARRKSNEPSTHLSDSTATLKTESNVWCVDRPSKRNSSDSITHVDTQSMKKNENAFERIR